MNTPNDTQATPDTERTDTARPIKKGPAPFTRKSDPAETAQEETHEVLPKTAGWDKPGTASPGAARGNDDVMSQQGKPS